MFKGNLIFSVDPAKTNTDRSEMTRSETILLNHTFKDNVQKKTAEKLEILRNSEWNVITRKWQLLTKIITVSCPLICTAHTILFG